MTDDETGSGQSRQFSPQHDGDLFKTTSTIEQLMTSVSDPLPGDRILKVNHAGEHGAVCIYRGQMIAARFTAPDLLPELSEFKSHEEYHRATFAAELERRQRPRCKSYWLCGIGGFVLGILTGFLGRRAIAATTAAVEQVVLRHLTEQLRCLKGRDDAVAEVISSIVIDEQNHLDRAIARVDSRSIWHKVLMPIVSSATEAVIWLGMRL